MDKIQQLLDLQPENVYHQSYTTLEEDKKYYTIHKNGYIQRGWSPMEGSYIARIYDDYLIRKIWFCNNDNIDRLGDNNFKVKVIFVLVKLQKYLVVPNPSH